MNITFACPHCDQAARLQLTSASRQLVCPSCHQETVIPPGAISGQRITRCLVCPSTDLYVRKDFPQRLGVALVAIGVIGSSIAWAKAQLFWTFAILFATALVDLGLYLVVGNALMCYRCHAQYRSVDQMDAHPAFDLETHERYRQLAARMNDSA